MADEHELWLPELIYPEVPGQIDDEYLDRLYGVFERDFVLSKPQWPERRFALKRMPLRDGYPATFWHLISQGTIEQERTIDLERCLRMNWVRQLLDAFAGTFPGNKSEHINWWVSSRPGPRRILVSLKNFSFVVIVEERRDYALLWTAYPTRENVATRLQSEHTAFWSGKG